MRIAERILRSNVDMTQGPPLAAVTTFALPLLVGNLFNQLYNVVDTAIVGRTIGAEALAAVGCTGNINAFLFLLLAGLSTGVSVIISQYWGARQYDRLRRLLGTFLVLVVGMAVVLSLIGVLFAVPFLRLLQTPGDLLGMGAVYLRITAGLLLGSALYNAAGAVLRSIGDSRTPLIAMVASSITNIVLDLVFILVCHWGVAGAAIATVISQFLSAGICLIALWREREPFAFATVRPCFALEDARLILRFGVPASFQSAMITAGGMAVQGLVNSFGSVTMAAYTAVGRIDSLAIQLVVSVSTTLAVYTAQNIGHHDVERVRRGLRQTAVALCAACLVVAVAVYLARFQLLSIFLDPATDAASIAQGADYLSVMGFAYIIAAVMNTYLNVLRGAGYVSVNFIAGLSEMGARLVFAYALAPHIGVWGIWLATPLSWAFGCIIPVVLYYRGRWTQKGIV